MGNKQYSIPFNRSKCILINPCGIQYEKLLQQNHPATLVAFQNQRKIETIFKIFVVTGDAGRKQICKFIVKIAADNSENSWQEISDVKKFSKSNGLCTLLVFDTSTIMHAAATAFRVKVDIYYASTKSKSKLSEFEVIESTFPVSNGAFYPNMVAFASTADSPENLEEVYDIISKFILELESIETGDPSDAILQKISLHYLLINTLSYEVPKQSLYLFWGWTIQSLSNYSYRFLSHDDNSGPNPESASPIDDDPTENKDRDRSEAISACLIILLILGQTKTLLLSRIREQSLQQPTTSPSKIQRNQSDLQAQAVLSDSEADIALFHNQIRSCCSVPMAVYNLLFSFFLFEHLLLARMADLHAAIAVSARSLPEVSVLLMQDICVTAPISDTLLWIWEDLCRRIELNQDCMEFDPTIGSSNSDKFSSPEKSPSKSKSRGSLASSMITIPHFRIVRLLPLLNHFSILPELPLFLFADEVNQITNSAIDDHASSSSKPIMLSKNREEQFCDELLHLVSYILKYRRGSSVNTSQVANDSTDMVAIDSISHRKQLHFHIPVEVLMVLIKASPQLKHLSILSELGSPGQMETMRCMDVVIELMETYSVRSNEDLGADLQFIELLQNWIFASLLACSTATNSTSNSNGSEAKDIQVMNPYEALEDALVNREAIIALLDKEKQLVIAVLLKCSHFISDSKAICRMLYRYASHLFAFEKIDIRKVSWAEPVVAASLQKIAENCCNVISSENINSLSIDTASSNIKESNNQASNRVGVALYQLFRYWSDAVSSWEINPQNYSIHCGYVVLLQKHNIRTSTQELYCRLSGITMTFFENEISLQSNSAAIQQQFDIVGIVSHNNLKIKINPNQFMHMKSENANMLDHLVGFEILVSSNVHRQYVFVASHAARRGWVNAIERALHAMNSNVIPLVESNAIHMSSSLASASKDQQPEVVAEEWYEIQRVKFTRWFPIKPFRFTNRHNDLLPMPVPTAPTGWSWKSLSGHKDYLDTATSSNPMILLLGHEAKVFANPQGTTDSAGWSYADALNDFNYMQQENRSSIATIVASPQKLKSSGYRRRKWVRIRTRITKLNSTASSMSQLLPTNCCAVNSIRNYQVSASLAAPMSWDLSQSPSPRDIILSIARIGIYSAFDLLSRRNVTIVKQAEDLLDTVFCSGGADVWDYDIQCILIDAIQTTLAKLSSSKFQRTCITYICKHRPIDASSTHHYRALYFSILYYFLREIFVDIQKDLCTVNVSPLEYPQFLLLLGSPQMGTITESFRCISYFISPLFKSVDNFSVWTLVMNWLSIQWSSFPKNWNAPTAMMLNKFLNDHCIPISSIASKCIHSVCSDTIRAVEIMAFEQSSLWLILVQNYLKVFDIQVKTPASDTVTVVLPRIVDDTPTAVSNQWWEAVNGIGFCIAKEYIFEFFAIILGLRSSYHLYVLSQETSGVISYSSLKILWSHIIGDIAVPLDDIIKKELIWTAIAKIECLRLLQLCHIFLPYYEEIMQVVGCVANRVEQFSIRWVRQFLLHPNPNYFLIDSVSELPVFESCVSPLLLGCIPWLKQFDDWRNGYTVTVTGSEGLHTDKINGIYRFSFRRSKGGKGTTSVSTNEVAGYFIGQRNNGHVELQLNSSLMKWEITWHSRYQVSERMNAANLVLAAVMVSDLDNFGNQSDNWLINTAPLGSTPIMMPSAALRCVSMSTLHSSQVSSSAVIGDDTGNVDVLSKFKHIWSKYSSPYVENHIAAVVKEWKQLRYIIESNKTQVWEMHELAQSFNFCKENIYQFIRVLSKTTNFSEGIPSKTTIFDENVDWINLHMLKFDEYLFYSSLRLNLDVILSHRAFGEFVDGFLQENARSERSLLWSTLSILRSKFTDELCCFELFQIRIPQEYAKSLSQLQMRCIRTITAGKELLEWMRDSPVFQSDNDFNVQLERIRGKDVTMLPDEIPDEQSLTVAIGEIAVIRECFHDILIAARTHSKLVDFLELLLQFNLQVFVRYENIFNCVVNSIKIKAALVELFEADDDVIVPNKLLYLSQPDRNTTWRISPTTLHLTSFTVRHQSTILNYQNLVDFQSKLNLSQSKGIKDSFMQSWIDSFNLQFKWCRKLQEILFQLNHSGHPDFVDVKIPPSWGHDSANSHAEGVPNNDPFIRLTTLASWKDKESAGTISTGFDDGSTVVESFPLSTTQSISQLDNSPAVPNSSEIAPVLTTIPFPYESIRQRTIDLQQQYYQWTNRLGLLMERHYFFNIFSIIQIWSIIRCMQCLQNNDASIQHISNQEYQQSSMYLRNLFTMYGYGSLDIRLAVSLWIEIIDNSHFAKLNEFGMASISSLDSMEIFALWIDQLFAIIPHRERKFSNELTRFAVDYDHIESGLNIVLFPSDQLVAQSIISLYFNMGQLPERENILIVEESGCGGLPATMLINRWGHAHTNNRGHQIYVIANVERISTENQRELCVLIQKFLYNAATNKKILAKLVLLVSGQNRASQSICESFFGNIRQHYRSLPQHCLTSIMQDVTVKFCHQMTMFISDYPGQGKSFQIRTIAKNRGATVIHIPIHSKLCIEDLIKQILTLGKMYPNVTNVVLHFEIGSLKQTHETFHLMMLELLLLDSLLNHQTGSYFALTLPGFNFFTCIEVSNWQLHGRMHFTELLPCYYCMLDEGTFVSSHQELSILGPGVGMEYYSQLQLVVKCLLLLTSNRSTRVFPQNFFQIANETADLPGHRAFELLAKYFQLTPNTSGHRIWSLIRIYYSQLLAMFQEGSYVAEVQEFMEPFFVYRTLQFLVLTALDVCQPATTTEKEGELIVRPWQASNHEFMCLQPVSLISNSGGGLTFLSLHSGMSLLDMMPDFRRVLENYNMLDTTSYETNFVSALNSIIGTTLTQHEANSLLNGDNCITVDSVMKMIAIFIRIQNRVPVVLMGECGCGKTQLIRYSCAYWGMTLVILDCHGGTTVEDIVRTIFNAELILSNMKNGEFSENLSQSMSIQPRICVFLDEINTTVHIGLISEIILNHSLNGVPISREIVVVAALNPYRLKPVNQIIAGLAYSSPITRKSEMAVEDNVSMSVSTTETNQVVLVYKVHPVPDSLLSYILDFGALEPKTEMLYVAAMISHHLRETMPSPMEIRIFCSMILLAQKMIREVELDSSAVSLRDVKRCLKLVSWFTTTNSFCNSASLYANTKDKEGNLILWKGTLPLRAYILSIAVVYYYRLHTRSQRNNFWSRMAIHAHRAGMDLASVELFTAIISHEEDLYCSNITFEDGIAKNEAVRENIFVSVTCIVNRIPLILVGKPGSSKTLTLQVIASNLNGANSIKWFWTQFPSVSTFSYQCSPLSTAAGIESQYERACAYQDTQNQQQAPGSVIQSTTILLLDEIGLAEHSPDQPLKVLHKILPEERISIVGISNWVLDPAKMNRAILLSRPDPTPTDLEFTGQAISNVDTSTDGSGDKKGLGAKLLTTLAAAFHEVYTAQVGRPFFGMRDYYSLLKYIRRKSRNLDWPVVMEGLCRNFGGKKEFLDRVINCFLQKWQSQLISWFSILSRRAPPLISKPSPVLTMITDNLGDMDVRHLMVITLHGGALSVLQGCRILPADTVYLLGSNFIDDQNEHSIVVSVNIVKECMARGKTLVLIDQETIFEALYDVLNMRTVKKKLKNGKIESMLRLAIGPCSQLCAVDSKFKLIVIVDQKEAFEELDVPLLSRFEKQYLTAVDAIPPNSVMATMVTDLYEWLESLRASCGLHIGDILPGYCLSTIESYVLTLSVYDSTFAAAHYSKPSHFSRLLKRCLTPQIVWNDPTTKKSCKDYFEVHGSLASVIVHRLTESTQIGQLLNQESVAPFIATSLLAKLHQNTVLTATDITLTSVRTWSNCATMNNCIIDIQSEILEKLGTSDGFLIHSAINVSHFKSEREFRDQLCQFLFNTELLSPSLVVIYCDAATLSDKLIRQVRFICEDLKSQRLKWSINDIAPEILNKFMVHFPNQSYTDFIYVPAIAFHIVLVLCDPPNQHRRQYPLDFNPQWREYFCDDVRTEDVGSIVHRTVDLLDKSPLDLARANIFAVENILKNHFRVSFASIRYVSGSQLIHSSTRLQILCSLMNNPTFLNLATNGIIMILEELEKLYSSNAAGTSKYRVHDHRDRSKRIIRSMREHLTLNYEAEIVFAFALLLVIIDRNYNTHLLGNVSSDGFGAISPSQTWFTVATDGCGQWAHWTEAYIRHSVVFARIRDDNTIDAGNDGTTQHLQTHFPFSFCIIRLLQQTSTQESIAFQVETAKQNNESLQSLMAVLESEAEIIHNFVRLSFGNKFDMLMDNSLNLTSTYLLDVIGMQPTGFPGIHVSDTARLCIKYMVLLHPGSLTSLGLLHATMQKCSKSAYAISGILYECLQVDGSVTMDIIQNIFALDSSSFMNMAQLDFEILKIVINKITILMSRIDSPSKLIACKSTFICVRPFLNILYDSCIAYRVELAMIMDNLFSSYKLISIVCSDVNNTVLQSLLFRQDTRQCLCTLITSIAATGLNSKQSVEAVLNEMWKLMESSNSAGSTVNTSHLHCFLQKCFQGIVFDVVIPSMDVMEALLLTANNSNETASPSNSNNSSLEVNIRMIKARRNDLVEGLIHIICGNYQSLSPGFQEAIGPLLPFLRRSILNYLLCRQNTREVLESHIQNELKGDRECSFCLCNIRSPVITNCGHIYCKDCITEVLEQMTTCPMCRAENCQIIGPCDGGSRNALMDLILLYFCWNTDMSRNDNLTGVDSAGGMENRCNQVLRLCATEAVKEFGLPECCQVWNYIQTTTESYVDQISPYLRQSRAELTASSTKLFPKAPWFLDQLAHNPPDHSLGGVKWAGTFALRRMVRSCGESAIYSFISSPLTEMNVAYLNWAPIEKLKALLAPKELDIFLLFPHYCRVKTAVIPAIRSPTIFDEYLSATTSLNFATRTGLLFLLISRIALQQLQNSMGVTSPEDVSKFNLTVLKNWIKPIQRGISGFMFSDNAGNDSYWKHERHNSPSVSTIFDDREDITRSSSAALDKVEKIIAVAMTMLLDFGFDGSRVTLKSLQLSNHSAGCDYLRVEVMAHVCSRAIMYPGGWVFQLLTDPNALCNVYLPSMPDDDIRQAMRGLDRSSAGARRAYRCECGNLYFIGDCGKAWEIMLCPQCQRPIGGHQHQLVDSSKAIEDSELLGSNSLLGYVTSGVSGAGSVHLGRKANPITIRFLRLVIHSCLLMTASICASDPHRKTCSRLSSSLCKFLNGVLNSSRKEFNLSGALAWCQDRVMEDWNELAQLLHINDEILSRLIHFALSKCDVLFSATNFSLVTIEARETLEFATQETALNPIFATGKLQDVENCINQILHSVQQEVSRPLVSSYGGIDVALQLLHAEIFEENTEQLVNVEHLQDSLLWRSRIRVSFDDFILKLNNSSDNKSFLNVVLANERNLNAIHYLPALLRWHQVLFEAFPDGAISRKDAHGISNEEVLMRLPLQKRDESEAILMQFIEAFNASFPLLEYIYECEINPYRNSLVMSRQTSIAFSLPTKPNATGVQAHEGICTVALTERLVSSHNLVLDTLEACNLGYSFNKNILHTSQLSSMGLLQSQLCSYDRHVDLIPLLFNYAIQGLQCQDGFEIHYDFESISAVLAEKLFAGKQRISLNLRLYQYMGEIAKSGFKSQLNTVIKQQPIPPAVERTLRNELEHSGITVELLRIVETAVRLLATSLGTATATTWNNDNVGNNNSSVGIDQPISPSTSNLDPSLLPLTPFHVFVINGMQLESTKWIQSSVPVLRTELVLLCHLSALHSILEECLGSSMFSKVDERYKVVLEAGLIAQLNVSVDKGLQKSTLAVALKRVLEDNLADNVALNVELSLKKDLLNYIEEFEAVAGFQEWFPESIRIKHCLSVYEYFQQQ